jgi:CRISPR-associated protein Cas2
LSGLNCYIVCYDVRDPGRLCRVHRTMKGFGEPIQYSVFLCDLTPRGRVEMVATLTDLIDTNDDRIMIIDLGPKNGKAEEKIEFLGAYRPEEDRKFIIV